MRSERPGTDEYAEFYHGYVERVPSGDVVETLRREGAEAVRLLAAVPESRSALAYAPGKWTIREVVGHVTDSERVFAYRVLRFARGDAAALPGFDQDPYVAAGGFADRSLGSLVEELAAVRRATVLLLEGLPADAWPRRGVASGHPVSVRALAWIMAGHEIHHRAILAERYLPLVEAADAPAGSTPAGPAAPGNSRADAG